MQPQYTFSLNPHRFKKLKHCPDCDHLLEARKLPLLITVEPNYMPVFSITCHYCPTCDWLILDQHKLEGLLAAFFMKQDPAVMGHDYAVLGVVDQKAWKKGMVGQMDIDQLEPYIHKFKDVRPLKRQRKGSNLSGKSTPKKQYSPKSKRLSRRQRKKGKKK